MRRTLSASAAAVLLGLGSAVLLGLGAACGGPPETGPVAIHWDRDTCERCTMGISDSRFAAQIRSSGARRAQLFDDLGCALLWLDEQGASDAQPPEFWVRDPHDEGWLDAREAAYAAGVRTPMNYGFAPVGPEARGALGFDEVRRSIREKEDERRRDPR